MSITYEDSGVHPGKAAELIVEFQKFLSQRPKDPHILKGVGPFASCYDLKPLLATLSHPILVSSTDGVGTKGKLALDWGRVSGLGQDLVAMNVNDLLCLGAKPLVFLDYYACGALLKEQYLEILKSIQLACERTGCSLVGGETAEMPGLYTGRDFDLAGFVVGLVERDQILGPEKVQVGDVILALESSGPHSNGYSLVRKIIEKEKVKPEERSAFGTKTWAEVLLEPTTLYGPLIADGLSYVHALAHITGGGLFENLPRILPAGLRAVVSAKKWGLPPLFEWMGKSAGLSHRQLLGVFNCGVGLVAIVKEANLAKLTESLSPKIRCWPVGHVEKKEGKGEALFLDE